MTEPAKDALEVGTIMPDGSVFAGLTLDGSKQIYAMPASLGIGMSFNALAHRVDQLNAEKYLGYNDWQVPTREQEHLLYQNRDKGALKSTFNQWAMHRSYPSEWYCSSSDQDYHPLDQPGVRFSDGFECWGYPAVSQFGCRPVRLVPVAPALTVV